MFLYVIKQRLLTPTLPFDVETLTLRDGGTVRVAFADDPVTRALPANAPIVCVCVYDCVLLGCVSRLCVLY